MNALAWGFAALINAFVDVSFGCPQVYRYNMVLRIRSKAIHYGPLY